MNNSEKSSLPRRDNRSRWFSRGGSLYDTVLSTRIRLSRNIDHYRFPPSMGSEEREELCSQLIAFYASQDPFTGDQMALSLGSLSAGERCVLGERHILSRRLCEEEKGYVILSGDESLNVILGLDDHLQIIGLKNGFALDQLYLDTSRLAGITEKKFSFTRGKGGEFLTSRITEAGTGLRASVLMQLPSLSLLKNMDPLFIALMDRGLSIRGFTDDEDYSSGGMYQIYNSGGAGFTEDSQILHSLTEAVKILSDREEKSRLIIREGSYPRVEDRVYRSLGTLRYCRMLSENEALKHLAQIRQGICLGWISDIPLELISSLLLYSGKAHMESLLDEEGKETGEEACLERRAAFVRDALAGGLTFFGV